MTYDTSGTGRCAGALCLNASRWDAIHRFAAATGNKVVFGLSYPEGATEGTWDSRQAEELFNYSKKRGLDADATLFGFELGEELTKYKQGTAAFSRYTAAFHRCATLLRKTFGSGSARPKLMGPCPGMSWPQLATWFRRRTAQADLVQR